MTKYNAGKASKNPIVAKILFLEILRNFWKYLLLMIAVSPIRKKQLIITRGLLKLKTIINETAPKLIRVQRVTGIRFALSIVFCLKQK